MEKKSAHGTYDPKLREFIIYSHSDGLSNPQIYAKAKEEFKDLPENFSRKRVGDIVYYEHHKAKWRARNERYREEKAGKKKEPPAKIIEEPKPTEEQILNEAKNLRERGFVWTAISKRMQEKYPTTSNLSATALCSASKREELGQRSKNPKFKFMVSLKGHGITVSDVEIEKAKALVIVKMLFEED